MRCWVNDGRLPLKAIILVGPSLASGGPTLGHTWDSSAKTAVTNDPTGIAMLLLARPHYTPIQCQHT